MDDHFDCSIVDSCSSSLSGRRRRTCLPAGLLFVILASAADEKVILTPEPPPAPRMNGPKIYGARPGRPFLYRIPCTGERPMTFDSRGLPPSLKLDAHTGIITGNTPDRRGEYVVGLSARNRHGSARRSLKIVAGDQLALTPPMGWNDWYTHYDRIRDKDMRAAADVMISSGMADAGYQYVSIDDCWMVKPDSSDPETGGLPRDAGGAILPNKRFPDMKALADSIHSKGLKAGIYTSPGPLTCARFTGSYQHEEQDAKTFAAWGFDFLKYDWCSYRRIATGETLADRKKPYQLMGAILPGLDRDIVFNLCQYGMSDVWTWGGEAGGHSWRTTGDLGLEKDTRLPGFYSIAFKNAKLAAFAGPGRWNDPDYLLIGWVGNARRMNDPPRPVPLTPNEQYSYMSLWALMAAPLFYSGDMSRLDKFTLGILCNPEVIDIDQDPLGKQARIVRHTEEDFVLAKTLEDGSLAVGLFNLAEGERTITVTWQDLHLSGKRAVRDLWRQKNIGKAAGEYAVTVGRHSVMLVRLGR